MDEDCDGMIDWENFVQLYVRCRRDKTGYVYVYVYVYVCILYIYIYMYIIYVYIYNIHI